MLFLSLTREPMPTPVGNSALEHATIDPSIVIISERRTARGCSQQGVRFDPDMPQTIRLEFAKSNTKVSKPKPAVATAAPAAHPALMHPLTGRKYRRRTHRPARARPHHDPSHLPPTLITIIDRVCNDPCTQYVHVFTFVTSTIQRDCFLVGVLGVEQTQILGKYL